MYQHSSLIFREMKLEAHFETFKQFFSVVDCLLPLPFADRKSVV